MAQLIKKYIITGKIECLTGLHIGGTNSAMGIGGLDKLIIRNPLDNKPLIPGSSLKGKFRSLIELQDGNLEITSKSKGNTIIKSYGPTKDPDSPAGMLFGVIGDRQKPSRLIVRDCKFSKENPEFDLPYTETKTEVNIDRITSKANPRTFERVPAGAIFDLDLVLNIFDDDDEVQMKKTLQRALNSDFVSLYFLTSANIQKQGDWEHLR
jgi:CRISPR-associated protein Csm3